MTLCKGSLPPGTPLSLGGVEGAGGPPGRKVGIRQVVVFFNTVRLKGGGWRRAEEGERWGWSQERHGGATSESITLNQCPSLTLMKGPTQRDKGTKEDL